MPTLSAGLLVYRRHNRDVQVLLVHPGGPLWARKDVGAWSIPKGEYAGNEAALSVAEREFREELGHEAPPGVRTSLGEVRQPGGKRVTVWAVEGDADVSTVTSNTFEMEWPPRSGARRSFPEVDRAAWFSLADARSKLLKGQQPFLDRLEALLGEPGRPGARL